MQIKDAQQDMNYGYFGGGPGVLISGLVWCIAGFTAFSFSFHASMLVLFFGGMSIHPLSMLLSKVLKRSGAHHPENPLGRLALESTIILFVGLFLAFYVSQLKVEWFYPVMLLAIGVRYLIFQTLYGLTIYWLLGGLLMLAGMMCILFEANFVVGALIGGVLEVGFSLAILNHSKGLVAPARE